jgi:hypothetical protein
MFKVCVEAYLDLVRPRPEWPLTEAKTKALFAALEDGTLASAVSASEHELIAVEPKGDETPPNLVRFRPRAAAKIAASFLAGALGATSPLVLGTAVIYFLLACDELVTKASDAEAVLFWIVFMSEGHAISRATAEDRFAAECRQYGLAATEFAGAADGLVEKQLLLRVFSMLEVAETTIVH